MKPLKTSAITFGIQPLALAVAICTACFLFCTSVQAQTTYYWTNSMGGSWSTAANWLNGNVASGSGNIADFSTYVGLTNNTIVAVNTPVTIGSMIIGNSNVVYGGQSTNNWIFTDGGSTANTITLSGGSSTITVTNMGTGSNVVDFSTATISGTSGLTVNGGSSLELDVTNYYTGGTTIAGGTLIIGTGSTAGESMNAAEIYTLGSSSVAAASILRVFRNSIALANPIVCAPNAAGPLMIGEWNGNTLQITDPYMNLNGDTLIFTNGADNSTHNFVIETSGSTTAGITNYGNITLINNSPSGDYFSFGAGTPGDVLNCIGTVTLEGTATSTASKVSQYYYGPAVTNINIIGPCPISAFNAPTNTSGDFTINSTTMNTIGAITLPAGLSNATFNVNNSAPIKVGTVAAGFQGNIVNSGTGPGALLITGAITTGTSNVVQNSTGSSLVLSAANTYNGGTIINAGSLVLTNSGSIADTANISIAAAATFDVSALSANTFTAGSSSSLSASGTGTTVGTSAAAINGKSGGTVSLGSIPITLNFDGADPALYISQGTLSLNGNAFTINSSSPLAVGTYTIIQQASGNITSSGTYPVSGTAIGAGYSGTISVSGGTASLVVAFIGSAPIITSVSPASGITNGETFVTISGFNFASGATVQFGSLAGVDVDVISSTTITVTTPAETAGTVPVIMENPNTQTATNSFTYVVGPIEPIAWDGYNWNIKSATDTGPGPNAWNPTNVFIDSNGDLHLDITYNTASNEWECGELYTTNSLGFGTYQWQTESHIDAFDPWVDLGLFPYAGPDGNNEIDIEYSRWGITSDSNLWWTIWPNSGTNVGRASYDFSLSGTNATSRMIWTQSGIQYWLMNGFQSVGTISNVLDTWNYTPTNASANIPQNAMPLHMNLWLYKGHAPANGQPVDCIIHNFSFTPYVPPSATISSMVESGGNLILVWQGVANTNCVLLSSTNIALPVADWTPVKTNTVGANGLSTNTLPISPSQPHQFFLLDTP